ncbi:unnamed protein product [Moneuplotes crassus]|uniref:Uncharacterized protein n=1 Tax=Euplotes crassus TaxID=5936 RepID=A0AAD1XZP9_EUPCR|nr:unnamed protein product [Moneuplotes crassus]
MFFSFNFERVKVFRTTPILMSTDLISFCILVIPFLIFCRGEVSEIFDCFSSIFFKQFK